MPKLSLRIFKRISNNVYHYLTLNVRARKKINIPHINFVTENSQNSIALESNLNLLICLKKQLPCNFGINRSVESKCNGSSRDPKMWLTPTKNI